MAAVLPEVAAKEACLAVAVAQLEVARWEERVAEAARAESAGGRRAAAACLEAASAAAKREAARREGCWAVCGAEAVADVAVASMVVSAVAGRPAARAVVG